MAVVLLCFLLLCACDNGLSTVSPPTQTTGTVTSTTQATTTTVMTTSTTPLPPPPEILLSLDGIPLDGIFGWFEEVCLDVEYSYGGNDSCVQKWTVPIRYSVDGTPTEEDIHALERIADVLGGIQGFPGIAPAGSDEQANLTIWFCSGEQLVETLGDPFTPDLYGGTRFWYTDNAIYEGVICCREDIDQFTRDSVIVEEIYNLLGPIQDTETRNDSVIYQYSNENTELSPIDLLILQLLYHPTVECGMTADKCERVIDALIKEQTEWLAEYNSIL